MKTLRFFLAISLILALLSAAWIVVMPRVARPPFDSQWIDAIYRRKEAAARTTEGKLVLVGGSSTHYSFSAQTMTELTGIPAVNLGTHAGLGLSYILHRAKAALKPNDIVVLSIEPNLFSLPGPTFITSQYSLFYDPSFLRVAPLSDVVHMAFGVQPLTIARHHLYYLVPWSSAEALGNLVGPYGDETRNRASDVTAAMRSSVERFPSIPALPVDIDGASGPIREFHRWASQRNITVLSAWTPLLWRESYDRGGHQEKFRRIDAIYREINVPVLGTARDFGLSLDETFDTIRHANDVGRARVTRTLAELLCSQITCRVADPSTKGP